MSEYDCYRGFSWSPALCSPCPVDGISTAEPCEPRQMRTDGDSQASLYKAVAIRVVLRALVGLRTSQKRPSVSVFVLPTLSSQATIKGL